MDENKMIPEGIRGEADGQSEEETDAPPETSGGAGGIKVKRQRTHSPGPSLVSGERLRGCKIHQSSKWCISVQIYSFCKIYLMTVIFINFEI